MSKYTPIYCGRGIMLIARILLIFTWPEWRRNRPMLIVTLVANL